MGSTLAARLEHTMIHDSASEVFVDKTDHSSILYCTAQNFYQTTVAYRVEEPLKVKVYNILVA